MFGQYNNTFELKSDGLNIAVIKEDNLFRYKRITANETVNKVLAVNECSILINPVEPLNTPKKISSHLMIAFNAPLLLEPKMTKKIYVKFPIEFGVFLTKGEIGGNEILDIFTLAKNKFTLYGDIKDGVICKYYKSDIFSSIPKCNPIYEGVIELDVINKTGRYVSITKVIFNSFGMKIYYNKDLVSLKANMTILGADAAEVDLENVSIQSGMKKSFEVYLLKMMSITGTKFMMEWGL
jgi:hypothetical protein